MLEHIKKIIFNETILKDDSEFNKYLLIRDDIIDLIKEGLKKDKVLEFKKNIIKLGDAEKLLACYNYYEMKIRGLLNEYKDRLEREGRIYSPEGQCLYKIVIREIKLSDDVNEFVKQFICEVEFNKQYKILYGNSQKTCKV